jgi:hypothetical protein
MTHHDVYFPDPTVIEPLATEFVRMMFAHTDLERQVFGLQAAIKGDQNFAGSRWFVHEWPEKMAKLIKKEKLIEKHLGTVAEAEEIAKWLTDAKPYCDSRNRLAHGAWWRYYVETSAIEIRWWESGWVFKRFKLCEICEITGNLKTCSSELYKLRREIEHRRGWHDFEGPDASLAQ